MQSVSAIGRNEIVAAIAADGMPFVDATSRAVTGLAGRGNARASSGTRAVDSAGLEGTAEIELPSVYRDAVDAADQIVGVYLARSF